jgi:hypothetical protein
MLITLQDGSISNALTKSESKKKSKPPPVSDQTLTQRFITKLVTDGDHEVQLSTLFSPDLDNYSENDDFIKALLNDVTTLFSIACIHHEKNPRTNTTGHFVSAAHL